MNLKSDQIHYWKELGEYFMKQYQYNIGLAPDRMQLQGMTKKEDETFKEYVQRWRRSWPPCLSNHSNNLFTSFLWSSHH